MSSFIDNTKILIKTKLGFFVVQKYFINLPTKFTQSNFEALLNP